MKKLRVEIATVVGCEFIDAARPDDVNLPEGMEINHLCIDRKWHIVVTYLINTYRDVYTLKNTLDEIMKSLRLVENLANL